MASQHSLTAWRAWAGACLLSCLGVGAQAAPEPPPGTVALYEKDLGDAGTLKFNDAWGWSNQYNLKVPDAVKKAGKVRYVAFSNIPSASTLVLSSSEFCEQTDAADFWIELTAAQEFATYPLDTSKPLPISDLMAMAKDRVYGGLRVTAKHQKPGAPLDGLACVRMATSRRPGDRVPTEPLQSLDTVWRGTTGTETSLCGEEAPAIAGRRFYADRQEYQHRCANGTPGLQGGEKAGERPQAAYAGGYDVCPSNTAVWAFTGTTRHSAYYRLACRHLLDDQQRPLAVIPDAQWHGPIEEGNSEFECPSGQVLVGRKSENDGEFPEDARTWYACATVLTYADSARVGQASPAASNGSITFFSQVDRETGLRKPYKVELSGFGTTRQYELRNWASPIPNNHVEQLEMEGIPSATRILLTDDELCDAGKGNFAVSLVAWREGATLAPRNIADLGNADTGYPVGDGLRLESRRGQPGTQQLSCMRVELSRLPGEPGPTTQVPLQPIVQKGGGNFTCDNGVVTGLSLVEHKCASASDMTTIPTQPLEIKGATDKWVMCPFGTVLSGLGDGVGNGRQYHCASLSMSGKPVSVQPVPQWDRPDADSFDCPHGQAVAGVRPRSGDFPSQYRCATLLY